MKRVRGPAAIVLLLLGVGGCQAVQTDAGQPNAGDSDAGTAPDPGATTPVPSPDPGSDVHPFQPVAVQSYVRKVKSVLTGLAITDADLVRAQDVAGLQGLIDDWMKTPEFQEKMLFFFKNAFQQSTFAVADFDFQLQNRPGAFQLPYGIYGDDAFPTLQQNLRESFARTALQLVVDGKPFNQVLTTRTFYMTTALKSLYLQIETPRNKTPFFVDEGNPNIPITDTLNPASANYLHFSDAAPTTTFNDRFATNGTCRGQKIVSTFSGSALLFQVLLGVIPRATGCMEHASKPYFTPSDVSDWKPVTLRPLASGEKQLQAFDLPAIRAATSLGLKLPRVGFFTTPAFVAAWNTNHSNRHRVTAISPPGRAQTGFQLGQRQRAHAAKLERARPGARGHGQRCLGCDKSLDPLKQFFAKTYDFDDEPLAQRSRARSSFASER